jgi:hypothetical protein
LRGYFQQFEFVMNKKKDAVDRASESSFPASDPPASTPVVGSGDPHVAQQVLVADGRKVIRVTKGRGEELRYHLAAHGIAARVNPLDGTPQECDCVEIDPGVDADEVQAIIDEWED